MHPSLNSLPLSIIVVAVVMPDQHPILVDGTDDEEDQDWQQRNADDQANAKQDDRGGCETQPRGLQQRQRRFVGSRLHFRCRRWIRG